MATVLGKRKSRIQKADPSVSSEEVQAKLARFFEAQFKPLFPTAKPTPTTEPQVGEESASDSDGSNDDSWGGLSEDEAEDKSSTTSAIVEVVSHTDTHSTATNAALDKRESRAWLSSRPPVPTSDAASSSTNKKGKPTTANEDAPSLLKNDLALQRLLAESHLFSSVSAGSGESGNAMEHVGRNRHLATDLRLSALGSKTSIYKQAKMPMSFRKGIQATAEEREAKRRREARENGIVLERPGASSLSKKAAKGRRNGSSRAIDAPAVGRMNNGMLKLSKKDIADIEDGGPRKRGAFTKKRRR
ncbi:hypothetical protein GQX73_g4686 [Xylaria multiplex]|uniref:Protein FAF1 n=1 Tax=Xylaria multiplex TaxID=323545 RepID=A0A7C8IPE0_9PEZI|nr:hypothetical protein GQX73_g4686 [Xylaria multiplex]